MNISQRTDTGSSECTTMRLPGLVSELNALTTNWIAMKFSKHIYTPHYEL